MKEQQQRSRVGGGWALFSQVLWNHWPVGWKAETVTHWLKSLLVGAILAGCSPLCPPGSKAIWALVASEKKREDWQQVLKVDVKFV